jgi:HAD superfamily hydrolase (TIGR01509 family)
MTNLAMTSKRCFLFDLDGTLVDSTPAHARAFIEALQPGHRDIAASFDYAVFAGRPTREVFIALGLGAGPEVTELTSSKQRLYREALDRGEVKLFPGVLSLLQRLREGGGRLFLVTGASRISALRVLKMTGLEPLFEGVVTADDTPLGKPAPDPYRHAMTTYGLAPEDCLAIEDGESGIRSAQAAGVEPVLIHTKLELAGVRNVGASANLEKLLFP